MVQQGGRGRGAAPLPPAHPLPPGGSTLQRLAAGVQQQEQQEWAPETAASPGNPNRELRHMQSSVGELLGGHPHHAAQHQQKSAGWASPPAANSSSPPVHHYHHQHQQEQHGQQKEQERQQQHPAPLGHQQQHPPAEEGPANDFSRRNMARLGGEGVAGILGAGELLGRWMGVR